MGRSSRCKGRSVYCRNLRSGKFPPSPQTTRLLTAQIEGPSRLTSIRSPFGKLAPSPPVPAVTVRISQRIARDRHLHQQRHRLHHLHARHRRPRPRRHGRRTRRECVFRPDTVTPRPGERFQVATKTVQSSRKFSEPHFQTTPSLPLPQLPEPRDTVGIAWRSTPDGQVESLG